MVYGNNNRARRLRSFKYNCNHELMSHGQVQPETNHKHDLRSRKVNLFFGLNNIFTPTKKRNYTRYNYTYKCK